MSNYMKNLFSKFANKKKASMIVVSLLFVTATIGYITYESTKKTVDLTLDGEEKTIRTHANTVEDIFKKLNISLRSEDYINPSLSTKVEKGLEIVWEPAKKVQLVMEDEEKIVWTTKNTVEDLLREQNIVVTEHDLVEPNEETEITKEMVINIETAFPVKLVVGGDEEEVWTTEMTVEKLLDKEDVELGKLDRVEPNLKEVVQEDEEINVVRVEKVTDVVEEEIDFAVLTKKDGKMAKGQEKVVEQGKKGLLKKEYEVVLENGKEVSRKLLAEDEVKKKRDKVVAVGTKSTSTQVARGSSKPQGSGKELYVTSTAYTPNCNGCSGRTATGINIAANPNMKLIAVDPSVIPLGSKVYVEGYGHAIAGDTGGSIKGNKIDVLFPTKSDAYRWGVRKVKIKVLN